MNIPFLPRQWSFWLCCICGWWVTAFWVSLSNLEPGLDDIGSAVFSELIRFILTLPVLLLFRYWFIKSDWISLSLVELISLTLGFNLLMVFPIIYGVPFSVSVNDAWFDLLQRESITTSRHFDEKFVSFCYSYLMQLGWCLIYVLSRSFKVNHELEQKKAGMQAELDDVKLSSLSNQVSPHFLFNSLNNLCSLIVIDPKKSQFIVRSLSDLLRFCMSAHKQEKTSLERELRFVESYIDVSRLQFEEKLRYSKNISEEVGKYSVPPMMVQLLVENAIKHGVSKSKTGASLHLAVCCKAYTIEVIVENDGRLDDDDHVGAESSKMGLNNISQRLALIYGDKASFALSERDGMVRAVLTLPKEVCSESDYC